MSIAFFHGFALALGLILPLGVQNIFVFTQGAIQRRIIGWLPVVIAAALCDTLLILLAVGGVSVAVLSIAGLKKLLIAGGVVFLSYMGWLTWHSDMNLVDGSADAALWPLRRKILFALSVSLLNPHAILDTVGVIGTSSLSYSGEALVGYTAACILVSWGWFFMLAMAGRLMRAVDGSGRIFTVFNRVSAVIMWASAVYMISSLW